ncbi:MULTISPECIES: hypothetical protein [Pseudomonadaceae]|jgi:hypothetical protein|uniref:Uncharacterized protein n=1 Tax=Aquipseudomonas alcaligenes TaxID=43263 RepID=A0AA37CF11_AQUAC|nr:MULTISPECIES: hypothetical protein [Pseudomonas]AMR66153.1 hypothetical protein A0T30_07150 [Pseudomonas alcaligenes]MDC7824183.1 hypothetical protein [Pseudomonas sp. BLCC-B13]NMY43403.1 hypothetical protein [Pseudomonas sp. WS 5013]BCR25736.1 hypothetical protein KAM426_32630 [Pseudomonas alcaligenes]GIZ66285.1 hypothetical protein KAM428_13700 [Pseudomonas alcaligenes]
MRIDGLSSSYSLDRSPRPGSASTPLREAQREVEQQRQAPISPSATQGYEQLALPRRVEAGNASSDSLPARYQDSFAQQRGLSAKANQALAAYGSTSAYTEERDASEVLGLDLYA